MCNITINLGNIWDAFSAIGTIGATIVALWLGLRKPIKKLDIVWVWDYVTKSKPVIYLHNPTCYVFAIKSIELIYKKQKIAYMKLTQVVSSNYNGMITSNEIKSFVFDDIDLSCVNTFDCNTDEIKHKFKIIITDVSNKKYMQKINMLEKDVKIQKVGKIMLNN